MPPFTGWLGGEGGERSGDEGREEVRGGERSREGGEREGGRKEVGAVILGPPKHTHTHTHSMTTVLRHPIAMPTASLHLRCRSVSDTAEVGNITSFVHIVHEMVSDRLAHTHTLTHHTHLSDQR